MDIHDVRGIMSAILLITFVGIFVWVWIGGPNRFRDAEQLPFADEDDDTTSGEEHPRGENKA